MAAVVRRFGRATLGFSAALVFAGGAEAAITVSGQVLYGVHPTSGTGGVAGLGVRLYDSSGALLQSATTDGSGNYTFSNVPENATYYVAPNPPTSPSTLELISAAAGTGNIGSYGALGFGPICVGSPGLANEYSQQENATGAADLAAWMAGSPGAAAGSTTFTTLPCYGGRKAGIAAVGSQSSLLDQNVVFLTRINAGSAAIAGVNFTFATYVITNPNDSGRGSLREYLRYANPGQLERRSRFVPAVPQNGGGGTHWQMQSQATLNVGFHNTWIDMTPLSNRNGTTSIASSVTVGPSSDALFTTRPSFEIVGNSSIPIGIDMNPPGGSWQNLRLIGVSVWGFGSPANGIANAQIRYSNTWTDSGYIQQSVVGAPPDFADPGVQQGAGIVMEDHAYAAGPSRVTIQNVVAGYTSTAGIHLGLLANESPGTMRLTLQNIAAYKVNGNGLVLDRNPASTSSFLTATATLQWIRGWFGNNTGNGIKLINVNPTVTIQVSTITGNGTGGGSLADRSGVNVVGPGGVNLNWNTIEKSGGNGVSADSAVSSLRIYRNSMSNNAGLGIDLNNDGVTVNDANDTDSGANGLQNFPILKRGAMLDSATKLSLIVCAPKGAAINLFKADQAWREPGAGSCNTPDNTSSGRTVCYDEGQTFLAEFSSSSGTACSTYASSSYDGNDPSGMIEYTTTVTSSLYSRGDPLTATAMVNNVQTSEFSPQLLNPHVFIGQLALKETSNGGTGTFSYSITNADTDLTTIAVEGSATITTTASGTAAGFDADSSLTGAQTILVVDPATDVVLTINPLAGWVIESTSSCSDTAGNKYTLSGNTITIPAAKVVIALNLTCNISHSPQAVTGGIAGRVFKDIGNASGTANDGILNGGEAGLPNAGVTLTDCASPTALASAVTDGNGAYSFSPPSGFAGNACVVVALPGGFLNTGGSVGATATPDGTATTVAGTTYTYTRATPKIQFVAVAGTSYADLNFGVVPLATFVSDGRKAGPPGGVVFYPHTYTAGSAGSVAFTLAASGTAGPWTEVLYRDHNCNGVLDAVDEPVGAPVVVAAGGQICVILKEFIPLGMAVGAQRAVVLTAAQTYTGADPALVQTLSVEDVTTVGDSLLQLDKQVRNVTQNGSFGTSNSAKSGETLEYLMTYTNLSPVTLANLSIADATPAFTTFVSAASGNLPQSLTGCTKTTPSSSTPVVCSAADAVGGTGGIVWTFSGALAPNQSGSVSFRVRVQ